MEIFFKNRLPRSADRICHEAALLRRQQSDRLASVPAIDPKVVIQGEHERMRVQFGQSNQASVGQRHRNIGVTVNEFFQGGALSEQRKIDVEQATVQESEEFCRSVGEFSHEKKCFCY